MSRIAFIFPGQGSQFVGMGRELSVNFPVAAEVFDRACDTLGYDIKNLAFDGPESELNLTANTQPALLVAGVAALRVLESETGITPGVVAGHSLGEYTALVAAGALAFEDAVKLVRLRGEYMQEAVPEGIGKMCAIIGLDAGPVVELCEETSTEADVAVAANINSPGQVVISGHVGAVTRAAQLALERGAKRAIPLDVSVPSHSPLMSEAARRLAKDIAATEVNPLGVPIVTNVEATVLRDHARAGELLVKQLTSPVRWVESIETIASLGVDTAIEVGPGKVLSSLVKRIDRSIKTLRLGEPGDLASLAEL